MLWRCRRRPRRDAAGRYGQYLESALQALNENYANTWPTAVRVFCSVSAALPCHIVPAWAPLRRCLSLVVQLLIRPLHRPT